MKLCCFEIMTLMKSGIKISLLELFILYGYILFPDSLENTSFLRTTNYNTNDNIIKTSLIPVTFFSIKRENAIS